jgi:glycine betaine/choline ABC-type transport system substrate-binding protein
MSPGPSGVMLSLVLLAPPPAQQAEVRPIIVASKPFGESYLLAEMFAQLLEARGFKADRRPGLGATEIAFAALRSNRIDVYPEYTGTGLLAILGERPNPDPRQVFRQVEQEFRRRYGTRWLPPLGFQNTYAIAVRRETAERLQLKTLSDLGRSSRSLRAGLTPDFIGRADGLPGIEKAYGIRFRSVRALLAAVKYQALAAGEVDVIDGYSTDGFIARYDLVVLEDDRGFFPPYEAAALISPAFAREVPGGVAALTELSGLLTEDDLMGESSQAYKRLPAPVWPAISGTSAGTSCASRFGTSCWWGCPSPLHCSSLFLWDWPWSEAGRQRSRSSAGSACSKPSPASRCSRL